MRAAGEHADAAETRGSARARSDARVPSEAGPGAPANRPVQRRTLTRSGVLRLQRHAGNAAVARLIARGQAPAPTVQRRADDETCPEPAPAPTTLAPREDPRFARVEGQIGRTGATLRAHPPATAEANRAAAAAEPPAGDREAQASAAQADRMSTARPGGFDKAAFIAAIRRAVAAKAPKNLEEADKFGSSGGAGEIRSEVKGTVTRGKDASARDIATRTAEPPDPSKARDKPVVPLEERPAPRPTAPDTAAAMPARAPSEQTDLRAGGCETGAMMAEAGVTTGQLARSNEPELTGAVEARRAGEQHSATAPAEVRQAEAQTLQGAAQGAGQAGQTAVGAMAQTRGAVQGRVSGGQNQARSRDEAARARIAGEVKRIFDATKADVERILTGLDAEVDTRFTTGEAAARAAFEADHKARMDRYKDQRYSGLAGAGRWLRDKFASLPAEANDLFRESKQVYESKMDQVISDVADHVGRELTRAKDRIAQGREQITKFVASQPRELQKVATDAAGEIGSQFDQLDSDVDAKQSSLVDDLATRYSEARQAVDDRIKELQDANKGLWDKAKDAVGGAVRTILQLKDMLLGVLARAAGAVETIIKDPIGFLGKLINAVKGGVTRFAANIVEHLKKGLQGWLFGALANAGIEIPEALDLKGIIKLVLSVLGLTWTRIRSRLVARIGETAMGAVEKGVEIFKILATEGVGGLWRFLIDKLSDLKDTVLNAIQDFVVVRVVKAGITWLISALNPAAAFIKACKMIYDVVMFFVEKGSQIKEFVDSVLDSIGEIASGAGDRVASFIESTLARILPLLIGFLASLLGLGGISDMIKSTFEKVQEPVEKAFNVVVNAALKFAAPLINLAKRGAAWAKGKYEKGKAWAKAKYEKGKAWAKRKLDAVKSRLGLGPKPREDLPADKQQHVDMAAREIEPRARAMLARGVPESELHSSLRAWRSEYRLVDLSIDRKGGTFDITAKVNPTANVIRNAVDMMGSDVSRTLREIGNELLRDPAIRAEVERIRQGREAHRARQAQSTAAGGPAAQPVPRPAESPVAEAAALRPPEPGQADPRRQAGQLEHVEMGGQQVSEQQSRSSAPGHIHTRMDVVVAGALMRDARYNPEVQTALRQMDAAGIPRTDIQNGMLNLLANRSPGPAFSTRPEAAGQLAAITRLMFVVEPARNPAAFATSFMGMAMAGDPNMPLEDMATAANPMHAGGAGAMSRTAAANLAAERAQQDRIARGETVPGRGERQPGGQRGLDGELMLLAERDVVIAYLEHLVRSKELQFGSQHAVELFLRARFKEHLLEKLRAALTRETARHG